ncbi:MAG: hypothetical protein RI897_3930 [Verrucomicrobiota bacterium]|jgi:hypothetical protein
MKTPQRIACAGVAALLLHTAAWANDIEPGKEYYTAIKAPNPIVLDGDLSEWSGAALLADPRFSVPKGSGDAGELVFFELYDAGGPGTAVWTGPDDQTSAVQVVYDDDNVYFGFIVTDEYHENSANSAWNGDSVQLMIANSTRDQQVALYNYALGGVEEALGDVIVMHEAGPGGTEAVVTRNTTTKRTTYEIKLPKESLALDALGAGVRFGLGMAINDGDQEAPGQQGWGGLGAHALVFGKSPSETALVTLAASNDIEPGKEYYTANPAPAPVVVDGLLNEWGGVPVLSDPRFAIPKGSGRNGELVLFELYDAGGPGTAVWTGPDDHTSAVQIVYDQDNVYFGFVVTDEYHENSANSAWNGDSIQLMIADGDQAQQVALYNYALGGVEENLGSVIVMHESGPGGTEAVVTRNTTTKRTTYEIKLPAASLGMAELGLGTQFGLGMAINDGDKDAPGQQGWGGLGAHALVFGKSPEQTALVTLGVGGVSADLMFLSAINPTAEGFAFRANDKGSSIVDPDSAKLTIDGVEVALTVSPKNLDATDFSYTRAVPLLPGSEHTYSIEISDLSGNTIVDTSTFTVRRYGLLTPSMKAVSVDTSKPGFLWRMFQNDSYTHTTLAETELALAGQLVDGNGTPVTQNLADPTMVGVALGNGVQSGPLVQFEIATVINLVEFSDDPPTGIFIPDDVMPGIPGTGNGHDGIDAEIITFVDLPAGWVTLGFNGNDGFRMQGGYINSPADGILLGEREGAVGGSGTQETLFSVYVQEAGVYPIRTIWQEGAEYSSLELFSVLPDSDTKVLINGSAAGALKSYRIGVAPDMPTDFTLSVGGAGGSLELSWDQPGVVLQESTDLINWTDLSTATSPFTPDTTANSGAYYRLKQ